MPRCYWGDDDDEEEEEEDAWGGRGRQHAMEAYTQDPSIVPSEYYHNSAEIIEFFRTLQPCPGDEEELLEGSWPLKEMSGRVACLLRRIYTEAPFCVSDSLDLASHPILAALPLLETTPPVKVQMKPTEDSKFWARPPTLIPMLLADIKDQSWIPAGITCSLAMPVVDELLAAAQPSAFGYNFETLHDPAVRDSMEIPASKLCWATLLLLAQLPSEDKLDKLLPGRKLVLKPEKLVLYQKGGHFKAHRDSIRTPSHVGTLVCVLNVPFTGGAFKVHSDSGAHVFEQPAQWFAFFGSCLHEIEPVTDGCRVAIIYEVHDDGEGRGVTVKPAETAAGPAAAAASAMKKEVPEAPADKSLTTTTTIKTEEAEPPTSASATGTVKQETLAAPASATQPVAVKVEQLDASVQPGAAAAANDTEATSEEFVSYIQKEIEESSNRQVVLGLQHKYTGPQLQFELLKGGDRKVYDMLRGRFVLELVPVGVAMQEGIDEMLQITPVPPHLVRGEIQIPTAAKAAAPKNAAGKAGMQKSAKTSDVPPAATLEPCNYLVACKKNLYQGLQYVEFEYKYFYGNWSDPTVHVYMKVGLAIRGVVIN